MDHIYNATQSHSREPSSLADDWDERPHTIEEVKAMLQSRKDAALKREKNLSHAFSHQVILLSSPPPSFCVCVCVFVSLFVFVMKKRCGEAIGVQWEKKSWRRNQDG